MAEPKPITEKPGPGPIEMALAGRPDQAGLKAAAHLDSFSRLAEPAQAGFTREGISVALNAAPEELRNESGAVIGLRVHAVGSNADGPLPMGDGWHLVVNPPIKVPDGTAHVELTRAGDPRGEGVEIEVANYREDLPEAMRTWLTESIKHDARVHGWKG